MREIISLQFGQCGNRVGEQFWELIFDEHNIGTDGQFFGENELRKYGIDVFFSQKSKGMYSPRGILVDSDPTSVQEISHGAYGHLFDSENSIVREGGSSGNNFAMGFYSFGDEMGSIIMERVRREAERCESLQGFHIIHSVGGGTGSGLASRVLPDIQHEFRTKNINTFSTMPSEKTSDIVVESYNTLLAMNYLIEYAVNTFVFDNAALYDACCAKLRLESPQQCDVNRIIAWTMSGLTTSLRFPGQLNAGIRKLAVNLVPYPRMHFLVPSFAPLFASNAVENDFSIRSLVNQVFDSNNLLASCDLTNGRFMSAAVMFRGEQISTEEVESCVYEMKTNNPQYFFNYVPDSFKTAVCDIPLRCFEKSVTFAGNTTSIHELFERQRDSFRCLFDKKAFLVRFYEEGLEEQTFLDAENNLLNLTDLYRNTELEAEDSTSENNETDSPTSPATPSSPTTPKDPPSSSTFPKAQANTQSPSTDYPRW